MGFTQQSDSHSGTAERRSSRIIIREKTYSGMREAALLNPERALNGEK